MRSFVRAAVCMGLGGASLASAQTPIPLSVAGNEARATIALPGDIGADLTIAFESVVGLTPTALDVSASLVSPLDPSLLGRLPGPAGVPVLFPVLVRIAPGASSALAFSGVAAVSLHTHNLHLDPAVPLALLKAAEGGPFRDVTVREGIGSYRAGGSTGEFSEFLIVVDSRPIDAVIGAKLDGLQALLAEHGASMPETVAGALEARLSQARALYEAGAILAAIGETTAFSRYVQAHSGQDIPDVWRAHDTGRVNVAGLLRSAADTLRFSLDRKASR
ncbi:MAG TPA: DUF6689 family protein [Vicinamibacteria bacterium]|nr:DUF6689 family protein [Vicinamibacteria bacterium]